MTAITVFDEADALYRAAADRFAAAAGAAVAGHGRFAVALAGGDTPRRLYALLAARDYAGRVDWGRAHLFWGDERHVPVSHGDSNYRMVSETLLSRVTVPEDNIHRVRTELPPDEAAADYEREIREFFGAPPRFDLVLLGMGADGHTASLFPGSPALRETQRLAVAVEHRGQTRLSLTFPVWNAAAEVLFLVTGAAKAPALAAALEGPRDPDLPAQMVRPEDGCVVWLVDRAAAAYLKQHA